MRYLPLIITAIIFSSSAFALDNIDEQSYQRTQERLERLEKDLTSMQQQVKGGKSSNNNKGGNNNNAGLDARMGQLEDDMRQLRGKIEEHENTVNKISGKIDKIIADIDFRLNAIEAKTAKPAATEEAAAAEAAPAATPTPAEEAKAEEKKEAPKEKEAAATPAPAKTAEKTEDGAAPFDAQNQYDKALELMKKSEYEKAEKALKDFITANKGSDLVSNAYYWLGESYYVREKYEQSAVNFLKGYQDRVKGTKAPDNLFKLGMSLDKLTKKKEACTTFDKILKEFPKDTAIKDKVTAEKKRIKCGA